MQFVSSMWILVIPLQTYDQLLSIGKFESVAENKFYTFDSLSCIIISTIFNKFCTFQTVNIDFIFLPVYILTDISVVFNREKGSKAIQRTWAWDSQDIGSTSSPIVVVDVFVSSSNSTCCWSCFKDMLLPACMSHESFKAGRAPVTVQERLTGFLIIWLHTLQESQIFILGHEVKGFTVTVKRGQLMYADKDLILTGMQLHLLSYPKLML